MPRRVETWHASSCRLYSRPQMTPISVQLEDSQLYLGPLNDLNPGWRAGASALAIAATVSARSAGADKERNNHMHLTRRCLVCVGAARQRQLWEAPGATGVSARRRRQRHLCEASARRLCEAAAPQAPLR